MKYYLLLTLVALGFSFTVVEDKRTLSFESFDSIAISNQADVFLSYGKEQSVVVSASEAQFNKLDLEVKRGTLVIKNKKNRGNKYSSWSKNAKRIQVYITLPTIKEIEIAGSGDFVMEDEFNLPSLDISIAGSGDVLLKKGSADKFSVSIAGSGDVDSNLETITSEVSIAGSGDVALIVEKRLEVSIAGSGDVTYKGNPDHVDVSSVGSGEVYKR